MIQEFSEALFTMPDLDPEQSKCITITSFTGLSQNAQSLVHNEHSFYPCSAVTVPIMQPPLYCLTCPHPNCPSMFKSQHRRTYHICTLHLNTHNQGINVEWNGHQNVDPHSDNVLNNAYSSDIASEISGLLPNNDPGHLLPQRIEHPQLNGMFGNLQIIQYGIIF